MIPQRHSYRRPRLPRRTSTYRVDDHENRSARCKHPVHFRSRSRLFNAVLRQVFAHPRNELFRILHVIPYEPFLEI
jgi:hypothetical protein